MRELQTGGMARELQIGERGSSLHENAWKQFVIWAEVDKTREKYALPTQNARKTCVFKNIFFLFFYFEF